MTPVGMMLLLLAPQAPSFWLSGHLSARLLCEPYHHAQYSQFSMMGWLQHMWLVMRWVIMLCNQCMLCTATLSTCK